MHNEFELSERRSFLNRLKFGAGAFAAAIVAGQADAQTKTAVRFEPARHEKDDWLDEGGAKHRMIFDTFTPEAAALAIGFAGNFIRVNQADYGVSPGDLSVVIVFRHNSVGFGYSDVIWAKYGATLSKEMSFADPKTKEAAKVNVYNNAELSRLAGVIGGTLDSLAKQGVQFAVCSSATRRISGAIARAGHGDTNEIFGELTSNLVNRGRMVPAGIVVVNRAQERGYSIASI